MLPFIAVTKITKQKPHSDSSYINIYNTTVSGQLKIVKMDDVPYWYTISFLSFQNSLETLQDPKIYIPKIMVKTTPTYFR